MVKNPQVSYYHHETCLTNFHGDTTKIMHFLLMTTLGACLLFHESPSTVHMILENEITINISKGLFKKYVTQPRWGGGE